MGIQINGNTDNISATDGGLTVSDLELNQTGVSTFHSHLHVADQIIHLDDVNTKIRFPSADTITFETAGSEKLRITSTGAINLTSENTTGWQLDAGDNSASYTVIDNHFPTTNRTLYINNETTHRSIAFWNKNGSDGYGFGLDNSGNFKVVYGSSERLRIDSNGYLIAKGDIRLRRTASDNGALYFGDTNNNYIFGSDADDLITFATANTERLRIDSSGRVLIGKTSGDLILDINASSDEIRLTKASLSDYTGIQLDRDASGNAGGYFGLAGAANHYITGSAQHDICVRSEANLVFSAGGGTEKVRINSSGYVGVKRSTPLANLHTTNNELAIGANPTGAAAPNATYDGLVVDGEDASILNIRSSADGNISYGRVAFSDDVRSRGYIDYRHRDGAGGALEYMNFAVAGSERLRITSSGDFGIGTDSPDRKLDVSGTGNVYGKFQSTDTTGAGIEVKDSSQNWLIQADGAGANSSLAFYDKANTTYRVHMKDNGNLQIVDGDLVLASGHGISFSASGNFGTMNSEILDDYEEGYWTPTIGGHISNGSSTYGNQKGSYVRIGGILHLNWYINWTSTSASGQFRIYGLPYAAATTYGTNYNITPGSMMFNNINVSYQYGQMVPYMSNGANQIVFYSSYHTSGWNILSHDSYTANGGDMICSITYRVA